jgi:hypothetical protein
VVHEKLRIEVVDLFAATRATRAPPAGTGRDAGRAARRPAAAPSPPTAAWAGVGPDGISVLFIITGTA